MSRAERRARARRGTPPPKRGSSRLLITVAAVAVAALAGWWIYGQVNEPPPPPPAAEYSVSKDGVRVAELDPDALADWCRREGLPAPPGVRFAEPAWAEALLEALYGAALNRDAASFGLVGMLCENADSHGSAEAYFQLAEESGPNDARWPYYLGCLYQVTGRAEDAAAALERAQRKDPSYPVTYARLAQLDVERGDLVSADARFRHYTELRAEDWLGLVGSARIALDRGDPDTALTLLEQARSRGGDDFQVNHALARTHAARGDREQAELFFARAEARPQGAWYRFRDPLDQALHEAGSPVGALMAEFERASTSGDWPRLAELAERILERRAGDANMMGNLAGLYRKLGRFDDAHALLDRAVQTGTDRRRILLLRSEIWLAQQNFPEALATADSAAALDSTSARAHDLRARALLMDERLGEAEAAIRQAIDRAPGEAGHLQILGEIRLIAGDPAGAVTAYERALALQDSPAIRDRLAQILTLLDQGR